MISSIRAQQIENTMDVKQARFSVRHEGKQKKLEEN